MNKKVLKDRDNFVLFSFYTFGKNPINHKVTKIGNTKNDKPNYVAKLLTYFYMRSTLVYQPPENIEMKHLLQFSSVFLGIRNTRKKTSR